jgi:hypothetical protein
LTRSQAAFEWLCSSLITLACLALPLLPAYSSYRVAGAATWLLLALWAVSRGCTSLPAWLLNAHATHGEFAMLAPTWRLLAAVVFEAALVLLPGGLLLTLTWRLLSEERQNCGEGLLRLTPLREVVRPCHFSSLLSPAAASGGGGAGGGGYLYTGEDGTGEDDAAAGVRLFHD